MPGIADNALVKAAPLIEQLGRVSDEPRLGPETTAFLEAVVGELPEAGEALSRAREIHPMAGELLEPLLALTLSPTMIDASHKRNVIPARCQVTVDCRLLPGQTQAEAEGKIRAWLGAGDYELEWIQGVGGTRSPLGTALWGAVDSFVTQAEPGAAALPIVVPGFTDSHWLRQAFGTVAYGFFPMREMDPELAARLIHSADERVNVADLELGLDFLRHAAVQICGEVS
jgi:acetylornithine deacetylase/succinyl-diaminopimelate desuccinylase-like protein